RRLHLTLLRRPWRLSRRWLHLALLRRSWWLPWRRLHTLLSGRHLLLLLRLLSRRLAGPLRRLLFFVGLRRRLGHDVAWVERRGMDGPHQHCRQYCPSQETFFCVRHQDLIFTAASKN
ncbi:MAG TPA: hypothetical protein VFN20_11645, partial [Candidatus Acidoferrum sp.]|nr:hypothetical protein [Candidatus Acidoferrum sp.]